jgi:hypothetical protein
MYKLQFYVTYILCKSQPHILDLTIKINFDDVD